ncbi:MAG: CHAT domain-containing protein [Bacteroidia bacterium]
MSERPVIFLAFANSSKESAYLAELTKEADEIYTILHDRADMAQSDYTLHWDQESSLEKLAEWLGKFENRVVLFHFAGHADNDKIFLTSGEAKSKGIARLLADQKNLKLVFLNGCSTKDQVVTLLSLGVPAVIATARPVNDKTASFFANILYKNLEKGKTLKQSFDKAVAVAEADDKEVETYRSISWDEDAIDDKGGFPWGLYVNEAEGSDEKNSVLNWMLPQAGSDDDEAEPYTPNVALDTVLDEMVKWDPALESEITNQRTQEKIGPLERLDLIVASFPWPIGSQIRILLADTKDMKRASVARFAQMLQTYQSVSRFICYAMVAQLWDEIRKKKAFKALITKVQNMISLPGEDEVFAFDYLQLALEIYQAFLNEKIDLFLEKRDQKGKKIEDEVAVLLTGLSKEGDPAQKLWAYFEGIKKETQLSTLKKNIEENFLDKNLIRKCPECERNLSEILKKTAFLVRYHLINVKEIDVNKFRDENLSFVHYLDRLHASNSSYFEGRTRPKNLESFTDSRSVLLVKSDSYLDEHKMDKNLNLSPLVIDRHTFERKKGTETPHIYLYSHASKKAVFYDSVDFNMFDPKTTGDISLEIAMDDDEVFPEMKTQFRFLLRDFEIDS